MDVGRESGSGRCTYLPRSMSLIGANGTVNAVAPVLLSLATFGAADPHPGARSTLLVFPSTGPYLCRTTGGFEGSTP
jgi:hypothetical protein